MFIHLLLDTFAPLLLWSNIFLLIHCKLENLFWVNFLVKLKSITQPFSSFFCPLHIFNTLELWCNPVNFVHKVTKRLFTVTCWKRPRNKGPNYEMTGRLLFKPLRRMYCTKWTNMYALISEWNTNRRKCILAFISMQYPFVIFI